MVRDFRSELQALDLEELLKAVAAVFTADTGLLVSTEGGVRVEGATVNFYLAGTQAASNRYRSVLIG